MHNEFLDDPHSDLRIEEVQETIRAIRAGEVDALVVGGEGSRIYTLEAPDKPYRLLVDQVPHPAATLTSEAAILACNRRFADLLDRPASLLIGKTIHDFVVPDSWSAINHLLAAALEAEAEAEITLLPRTAPAKSILLGARAVREGALGVCLVITDLSEQRHYRELERVQQALRKSQERLAADLGAAERLQEISTRLIQEGDARQLYEQIVEAAASIMRSDCATLQMFDSSTSSLRLLASRGFDPDSIDAFRRVALDASTTCGIAWRAGRRVVVADLENFEGMTGTPACGALLAIGIRAAQSTPLVSRSGQMLGMISTHWRARHEPDERDLRLFDVLARQAADLIDRKLAEAQREQLLESERAARAELERALNVKNEFLAMVSHELRSPLNGIACWAQLLRRAPRDEQSVFQAAQEIDKAVRTQARLIDDLLDLQRMAASKFRLHVQDFEFADAVEAAIAGVIEAADAKGVQLRSDVSPDVGAIKGDPVRIQQVISNLLSNAVKFTPAGGRVQLTASRKSGHIDICVSDTGPGIPPDRLSSIFDPFSQADRSTPSTHGGLGLGLAIVRNIVTLHGGDVRVESPAENEGATFRVRLPVNASGVIPQSVNSLAEIDLAGARVLLVDDDPTACELLARALGACGGETRISHSGDDALNAAAEFSPQVVLLDISMPGMDGHNLLRQLRSRGINAPAIAVTAFTRAEDKQKALDSGCAAYIQKPVDLNELIAAVDAALR